MYLILAIIALIVLLLALPLRIYLHYTPEAGFQFRVKYLFLTLADSTKEKKPKQPKKPSGKKKPAAQKKKSDGKATEKLLDLLGLKDVSSKLNLKRAIDNKGLIETIRGVFDAVYPLLTLLDGTMTFKKRNVDIGCNFEQDNITAIFDGQLNYRPIHVVGFLFGLIGRYIKQPAGK